MDDSTAKTWLAQGLAGLTGDDAALWKYRQRYYEGDQDLPFRPPGVSAEYDALREQSIAPFLDLVTSAPVQRMRAIGIQTGDPELDKRCMTRWQANKMDARQSSVLAEMMTHGRGITSVWPNLVRPERPLIRPESSQNVWLEPDPADTWSTLFAVKRWVEKKPGATAASALILPSSITAAQATTKTVAVVYDREGYRRYEAPGDVATWSGAWEQTGGGDHPFGTVPFVATDAKVRANGRPRSLLERLIPAQDAINTIRFNTLLAMQFSAFRQRIYSGYDPVLRDEDGAIVWQRNPDNTIRLDGNGQPMPIITSPGRFSVDRALAFPDSATKVYDLEESDLDNYGKMLVLFLTQMFAVAQAPPQYLMLMANISGDALTGAESTLHSLIGDLEMYAGEADEEVHRLASIASGDDEVPPDAEIRWADTEAKSFSQIADGVAKLVDTLPRKAREQMLPQATDQTVTQWDTWWDEERSAAAQPVKTLADSIRANAAAGARPADQQQ